VRDVHDRHSQLVVVHKGERVMAMIPVEFYDRWFAEREKAFQYFDEARARHIEYSDAEVEADVERAIREVREKDAESPPTHKITMSLLLPSKRRARSLCLATATYWIWVTTGANVFSRHGTS